MFEQLSELIASRPMPFFILTVLGGGFFIWACLFVLLRYLLANRKLTNAERTQMIEAGQSSELLRAYETQLRKSRFFPTALGLFVPCSALGSATIVSVCTPDQFAISLVAWICACIVCVASIICGMIIMVRNTYLDKTN